MDSLRRWDGACIYRRCRPALPRYRRTHRHDSCTHATPHATISKSHANLILTLSLTHALLLILLHSVPHLPRLPRAVKSGVCTWKYDMKKYLQAIGKSRMCGVMCLVRGGRTRGCWRRPSPWHPALAREGADLEAKWTGGRTRKSRACRVMACEMTGVVCGWAMRGVYNGFCAHTHVGEVFQVQRHLRGTQTISSRTKTNQHQPFNSLNTLQCAHTHG